MTIREALAAARAELETLVAESERLGKIVEHHRAEISRTEYRRMDLYEEIRGLEKALERES